MDMRTVRSFVVFVTFLFGFAACSSGGNRKIAQAFVSNAAPLNLIDEDTVEQIWIHCRTELREITKGIEDFDSHFSHEITDTNSNTIESEVTWLARRKVQESIVNLHPHIKQTLLDCIKTKNFPAQDYNDEAEPNTWLIKYRQLLSNWSTLSRRILFRKNHPQKSSLNAADEARRPFRATIRAAAADAPGPETNSPDKSPVKSPAPSKSGPASSPSPTSKSASKDSPSPPSNPPASPSPPGTPPSLPLPPGTPLAPPLPPSTIPASLLPSFLPADVPPARPGDSAPSNSGSNQNLVYAVIAVGCVAGLLLIALILVCFFKRNNKKEKDPTNENRDEKTLSNIGLADTSPGYSHMSTGIGRRSRKKSFRPPLGPNNVTTTKSKIQKSSVAESQQPESSTVDSVGGGEIAGSGLPPPPGKVVAPPPSVSGAAASGGSAPPPPPTKMPGPRPPPPPKSGRLPNPPKSGTPARPTPPAPSPHLDPSVSDGPKTKLKPFFWDKVLANPDRSMVWHQLKGGSFQVDEEMIESLFGVSSAERNKMERKKEPVPFEPQNQYIQIIDPKKAQNLAILLKALNVTTEEVCEAIKDGHELPPELVQTLLKMAPTSDEELKLRLFTGDLNQLGPAERFLKVLADIPYAFKRLESLLFMSYLQEELASLKESFATLEVACKELTKSRLFLKLLEAVLKTGNRMNDGTYRGGAQAFKLDTLLKLSDVKGTDGKTTLLHFVVQEIIRSEGVRAARKAKEDPSIQAEIPPDDCTEEEALDYYRSLGLKVVSSLSSELVNVRKAALIDGDVLTSTVSKLGHSLAKSREFLNGEMKTVVENTKFRETLTSFVQNAEVDVMWLLEEEKRMMAQVRSTADYFHGQAGKDEALRLFVIVRDFLIILDKVCREVKSVAMVAAARTPMKDTSSSVSSSSGESHQRSDSAHRLVFPTIKEQDENDDFTSSDDESP